MDTLLGIGPTTWQNLSFNFLTDLVRSAQMSPRVDSPFLMIFCGFCVRNVVDVELAYTWGRVDGFGN